jgi:L-alanine-DL-glutamate epimerase-like enolase superfamily enzyme
MRIVSISVSPLSVPLLEPFVIASGRVDTTRAALVRAIVVDEQSNARAQGLGEAAALPPVTREDQPELLDAIARAAESCSQVNVGDRAALARWLDAELAHSPVARAGVECALLDAISQLAGVPLCTWLANAAPCTLQTDITLPIAEPEHMAQLAVGYRARGFRAFKVKVGKRLDDDIRALERVHTRVPDASFRLDANAGFTAPQALQLMAAARRARLVVECFEQPCAAEDLEGMAKVTRESGVPVIADESVKDLADLERVLAHRACSGVNLKLAKSGGLLSAFELGRRTQAHGLALMCGGMVETRLGMSAMAHVACALGNVQYIDLDTAFLLAQERFEGGYTERGPKLQLHDGPGLALRELGAP